MQISKNYMDLIKDFDEFLPHSWAGSLVGADPGTDNKKNRTHRAAALDNQLGTHTSKKGWSMLTLTKLLDPKTTC